MNLHINLEVAACYYKKQEASSKITNHTISLSLSHLLDPLELSWFQTFF
jgi:hypothetical protein